MGDSLTSAINPKGLKQGVFKHSIYRAKTDYIYHQAIVFNMQQFSNIIYVGGNDASSGTYIECLSPAEFGQILGGPGT